MEIPGSAQFVTRLKPLVATRARQRMAVLTATTILFTLFTAGVEVVMPLWVRQDLGMTAGQWTQLRSLRFTGVLAGVVVLGMLSDRFGQRLLGSLSMFGTALILVLLGLRLPGILWVVMPIYGALMSTTFVNMNTLTQMVSDRRQGLANTIYRSTGVAVGIIAPILATGLGAIWHGYPPVFLVAAASLVIAGIVLLFYPGEQTPPPLGGWLKEVTRLLDGYWTTMRQRELVAFIVVSQLWGNILAGVGGLSAYWFKDLGVSDKWYGLLVAGAGILSLLATAAAGIYLDRISLRKLHGVISLLAAGCSVLMGLSNHLLLSAFGYLIFIPLTTMLVGPTSMWISRAAGSSSQIAAFSVHKIISAGAVALAMSVLGLLESRLGMRNIFLYGGLLGLLTGLPFFLLNEPPKPGRIR